MDYQIGYEVTALIFVAIIAYRFWSQRRPDNLMNSFFSVLLILALTDLVLDIITAFTIKYSTQVPEWLNLLLLTVLFFCQNTLAATIVYYIFFIAGKKRAKRNIFHMLYFVPYVFCQLCLFFSHINASMFYFDEAGGYIKVPFFYIMYACDFFYLVLAIVILQVRRAYIDKKQYVNVLVFVALSIGGTLLQFLFPSYLFIGTAIAISLTLEFFTLQNPLGMIDEVTGVFNKTCFYVYIESGIEKNKKRYVTYVIFNNIQISNFRYGLAVVKAAVKTTVKYFDNIADKNVYRITGDRFALVTSSAEESSKIADSVISYINDPIPSEGQSLKLYATVYSGIEVDDSITADRCMMILDRINVEKADAGNHKIRFDNVATRKQLQREFDIEVILQRTIESSNVLFFIQPVYCVETGMFTDAEVLARLIDDNGTYIPPMEFIPIAEKSGLILPFARQLLDKLCSFIRENDLDHKGIIQHFYVNLSAVELAQSDLEDQILSAMRRYNIDSDYICFEITENTVTVSQSVFRDSLHMLEHTTLSLVLDDFGTGYSNIDSILLLPFKLIKFDRSIVRSLSEDKNAMIVFINLLNMCKGLSLNTLVEGVETAKQAELIKEAEADFIQGYYYSYPLSVDDFIALIEMTDTR